MEIYDEDTLSPFELQRQKNIIRNYEFMIACGLPAKPLIYVKRQEVPLEERFKYVDESSDDSDEEWKTDTKKKKEEKVEPVGNPWDIRKKVKNPTSFLKKKAKEGIRNAKKSKEKKESVPAETTVKKKQFIRDRPRLPPKTNESGNVDEGTSNESVVEERSRRYPKRCARVNYEESVPDDDHYLFCDECANFYYGDCPIHGTLLPCGDNETGDGTWKNSVASLPEGLEIKESGITNAGLGVFATKTFTVGTTFGPYMGKKVRPDIPKDDVDTSYMWEA